MVCVVFAFGKLINLTIDFYRATLSSNTWKYMVDLCWLWVHATSDWLYWLVTFFHFPTNFDRNFTPQQTWSFNSMANKSTNSFVTWCLISLPTTNPHFYSSSPCINCHHNFFCYHHRSVSLTVKISCLYFEIKYRCPSFQFK